MNASLHRIFVSPFMAWLVAAGLLLAYLFTFHGFYPALREGRLNFGIDLVGGTYITLEVQIDKAIETELADKQQSIVKKLAQEKLEEPVTQKVEGQQLLFTFKTLQGVNEAASLIRSIEPGLTLDMDNLNIRLSFKPMELEKIKQWAVKGNIEVLRTRLDAIGVGEITIVSQGENRIIVELPNVRNPHEAKVMIGKAALLEIKPVVRAGHTKEELLDEYGGELPGDMQIIPGKERTGEKEFFLVPKYTDLTGRLLRDAYAGFGGDQQQSEMVVNFEFKPEGGEKFYELTKENINGRIAIIIDDVVITAPSIHKPIPGGRAYIYGGFTTETATELATLLKSGAFVAPVKFEEERIIGPSLGQESIDKGIFACLVGLALLFIFGVAIYGLSGFFAFLALLYNILLIMIMLSWLRATLTLPGLAGMVLTVGMAIDASVLIYESIREELFKGATPRQAVKTGFSDAMGVILDSNITTFLVGVVLYKFGTGPIQGFAVTMMAGILSTLITGLFFLRALFNFLLYTINVQKIRI